jgi:hypothetical protein
MELLAKESVPSILSVPSASQSQPRSKPPQTTAAISRSKGRPCVRSPTDLHMHPALEEVGWFGVVDDLNDAAGSANRHIHDPILIATDGTVLSGFGRWRLAVFERAHEIYCIEHSLGMDDSLMFMLAHYQTRRGWNAFVRIRLALTLKPSLHQVALNNMRSGGKYKGLANLPEAQHANVRQQVADMAGVCPRNVGNVETILKLAHPVLIKALGNDTLKIYRAMQLCKLPRVEQLEQFIRYSEDRATSKAIRHCLATPRKDELSLDPGTVIEALRRHEGPRAGSVLVRIVRHKRTVILVGQDLLSEINSPRELPLK